MTFSPTSTSRSASPAPAGASSASAPGRPTSPTRRDRSREEEASICADAGIEYVEYQVGVDAITNIVNTENDWATCLTTDQLATIWGPKSEKKITNWNQVDPSFPDEPLTLAGPGTDSGTFDYFTDAVNGEEGASRTDYNASEDDNVIVQAVSGEKGGLGYLGFTYYEENTSTLKALEVDSGERLCRPERRVGARRLLYTASAPALHLREDGVPPDEARGRRVRRLLPQERISLAEAASSSPSPTRS